MDGTNRPLLAILLVSLSSSACSFTKTPDTTSVELPVQPASASQASQPKKNLDVQFALARTFEQERDLDRAASLYRSILMQDARHVGALHRLAILCDQQGRHDESRKLFRRALALRPTSADLYCDLGYSFYCRQQWAQAEWNYRLALDAESDHERAQRHLGLALAAQGKDDVALKEFRKSGCSKAQAQANLAAMQTFTGRLDAAARSCQLARKADPADQQVVAMLSEIETAIETANARAQDATEVVVARREDPRWRSVRAVGFESRSHAEPTPAAGVKQADRREQQPAAESAAESQSPAAENTTGPLQRLLKWRRVEKSPAK